MTLSERSYHCTNFEETVKKPKTSIFNQFNKRQNHYTVLQQKVNLVFVSLVFVFVYLLVFMLSFSGAPMI